MGKCDWDEMVAALWARVDQTIEGMEDGERVLGHGSHRWDLETYDGDDEEHEEADCR